MQWAGRRRGDDVDMQRTDDSDAAATRRGYSVDRVAAGLTRAYERERTHRAAAPRRRAERALRAARDHVRRQPALLERAEHAQMPEASPAAAAQDDAHRAAAGDARASAEIARVAPHAV